MPNSDLPRHMRYNQPGTMIPHEFQSYLQQVYRGEIPGAKPFFAFGVYSDGVVADQPIWSMVGETQIPIVDPAGVQLSLVSTSAEDAVGGTGINSVHIHYLDSDLNEQSEQLPLTGLTPALTVATDIRWVQCLHLETVGSARKSIGTIEARAVVGGQLLANILAGKVRCANSFRRVPAGHTAYIAIVIGSSISGTTAVSSIMQIVTSEILDHKYADQGVMIPHATNGLQDDSEVLVLPFGFPVSAGQFVGVQGTTDKAGATLTTDWFGWLEQNN